MQIYMCGLDFASVISLKRKIFFLFFGFVYFSAVVCLLCGKKQKLYLCFEAVSPAKAH